MRAQGADGAMTIATTAPDPYDIALAHSRYVARLASAGLTDRESFNALASAPFVRIRARTPTEPAHRARTSRWQNACVRCAAIACWR